VTSPRAAPMPAHRIILRDRCDRTRRRGASHARDRPRPARSPNRYMHGRTVSGAKPARRQRARVTMVQGKMPMMGDTGLRSRVALLAIWVGGDRSKQTAKQHLLPCDGANCSTRPRPTLDVRCQSWCQSGLPRNPQRRPALGLTRAGVTGNLNLVSTARFADAQVAPVLRLRAHRRRLWTVPVGRA
jgi:hypothetical protein